MRVAASPPCRSRRARAARRGVAGDAGHHSRGERVVAHRLDRGLLDQPDVLVSCRVVDVSAGLGEDLANPLALLAAGETEASDQPWPTRRSSVQFVMMREEVVLGVVEEDQFARREGEIWRDSSEPIDPPAPVTSTTTLLPGSGRRGRVHPDGLAAEDVLDSTARAWRTTLPRRRSAELPRRPSAAWSPRCRGRRRCPTTAPARPAPTGSRPVADPRRGRPRRESAPARRRGRGRGRRRCASGAWLARRRRSRPG